MSLLPRRLERIKNVLNSRMANLTVLLEEVDKPHNLSAILRSCDAVGALNAHIISKVGKAPTFNSTAQGSQKWVKINTHKNIDSAVKVLKEEGFKLYGTILNEKAIDYRDCDFRGPTTFVLGAERWGLSKEAKLLMDTDIFIPMRGMVQSLNVSVAAATLLFEALRQREAAGLVPKEGEGLDHHTYQNLLFEWAYPKISMLYRHKDLPYPSLNKNGDII